MAKRLQYMDALGPTIEKARFAAAGGDVAAEEARLMDPNYIAPGVMEQFENEGTLQPYTQTMRENTESKIAGALESIGMSKQSARDSAIGFTGTTDASRGGMGVGVLDFAAPFSIPTAVQEASREVDRLGNDPNASGVDYIMPAITVGLSVAESLPLAKLATKPLKGFIRNLAKKSGDFQSDTTTRSVSEVVGDMSPEVREQYELIRANRFLSDNQRRRTNPNPYRFPTAIPRADEPLIASAGPSISRRKVIKGMAALPAAGALSKLPLGKVDEVAKVAKVAKVAIPKNFNILRDLPSAKNLIDEILEGDIKTYDYDFVNPDDLEDVGDDIMDLVDQVPDSDRFNVADTYDEVRESIKEELMDIYKLSDKEADELMIKEGFDLPVKNEKEISRMKSFKGSYIDYKETFPNSRVNFEDWEDATGLRDVRDIKATAKGTKIESDEFADRKAMIEKMLGN